MQAQRVHRDQQAVRVLREHRAVKAQQDRLDLLEQTALTVKRSGMAQAHLELSLVRRLGIFTWTQPPIVFTVHLRARGRGVALAWSEAAYRQVAQVMELED
jgi:hypothetical protein